MLSAPYHIVLTRPMNTYRTNPKTNQISAHYHTLSIITKQVMYVFKCTFSLYCTSFQLPIPRNFNAAIAAPNSLYSCSRPADTQTYIIFQSIHKIFSLPLYLHLEKSLVVAQRLSPSRTDLFLETIRLRTREAPLLFGS